jgi:hypothetical protein
MVCRVGLVFVQVLDLPIILDAGLASRNTALELPYNINDGEKNTSIDDLNYVPPCLALPLIHSR